MDDITILVLVLPKLALPDKNKDGVLDSEELKAAINDLQGNPTSPDVELLRAMDTDYSGDIDFEEFTHWWFSSQCQ